MDPKAQRTTAHLKLANEYRRAPYYRVVTRGLRIVTLCTGNVARSVMLGFMLATLADANGDKWVIRSAGTHVAEGSAMSARTRDALRGLEALGDLRYGAHRSRQLSAADCEWAQVILASEADNVRYVRRTFVADADKAVQLAQFVRYAPDHETFEAALRAVVAHEVSTEFDVLDPAGGDQATYDACARQLWDLAQRFASILSDQRPG